MEEKRITDLYIEMADARDKYVSWADKREQEIINEGGYYTFNSLDYLRENFIYTDDNGITTSLPYPSVAKFNYITAIAPKVSDDDTENNLLMSLWALYSIWIIISDKNDDWLSFKVSYKTELSRLRLPSFIIDKASIKLILRDITKALGIRKKHTGSLIVCFSKMMEEIAQMLNTERFSSIDYPYCYVLMTENESIHRISQDFGMLPSEFVKKTSIVEFACMLSSMDRMTETERLLNDAVANENTQPDIKDQFIRRD